MLAFLNDKLEETIAAVPTTDLEENLSVEKDGKSKRKLLGNPGDVIIE
jgi:platelet-activating factor acetylhydrolase